MSVDLTRISRLYVEFDVAAVLPDGNPATITGVDVSLLPVNTAPDVDTTWTAAAYAAGVGSVLLAGPDADATGALPVPAAGADLWLRVIDTPEVDAARVVRVTVK